MNNHLAQLAIKLILELSQARRERDLAIELLVIANTRIGYLESNQRMHLEFDCAMVAIDLDSERRRERAKVAA